MKNRSIAARAGFALAGWRTAFAREKSFRGLIGMSLSAVVLLVVLRPPAVWWAIVAVTCAMVLAVELLNAAIEALADLVHPEVHPEIKAIKDMASGAVLATNLAAIAVALALIATTGLSVLGK